MCVPFAISIHILCHVLALLNSHFQRLCQGSEQPQRRFNADPSPKDNEKKKKNYIPTFNKKRERIARYQQGRLAWYTRQLLLCRPFRVSCRYRGLHRFDRVDQLLLLPKTAAKNGKSMNNNPGNMNFATTWAKAMTHLTLLTHLHLILK